MSRSSNYAFIAKALSWLDAKPSLAAGIIAGLFVILSAPNLPILLPTVDEGTYILQAHLVRQGNVPYVDFFYHQTPLYLYALAAFSRLGADSVTIHRLFSLLATGLCGVVVMLAGRRLTTPSANGSFTDVLSLQGSASRVGVASS